MMQGAGGGGLGLFNNLLGILGTERALNLFGIGGQTSTQVATRFGAIPWYLSAAGNFGAIGENIEVTNMSSYALSTPSDNTSRYISGTLFTNQGSVSVKQRCIITRTATGSAPNKVEVNTIALTANYFGTGAEIAANSIFIPDTGQNAIDDINIFWMGRNDTNFTTTTVTNVTACVDFLASPKRFLVIGILPSNIELPGVASRTSVDAYNAIMLAKYPSNFIETTPPTVDELAFIKYTPTSDELTDIANGIFPRGMRPAADDTHLNASGYRVIAYRVSKKFKKYEW